MMILLETLQGKQHDLNHYGLKYLKLEVDSLSPRTEQEIIEGANGHVDLETTYDGRTMRASFLLQGCSIADYTRLRKEVFKLFDGKTYFYLIDSRQSNQRWRVRTATKYTPEKVNPETALLEIEFVSQSPYAESANKVEYKYSSDFSFNNIGDVDIDMVEQTETEIEFRGVSTNLTIRNKTTCDEWSYTGSTTASDVILLKGIRSTKNATSIFGQTNKKVLSFVPGWNDIEIIGPSDYEITIRTRFYYI